MNSDRLKLRKAIRGAITKVRDERMEGTLGRLNSDGSITVEGSRQNYVIVRMPNGTYTELPNIGIGKVPLRPGLPVKIKRLHTGELVLDGENERLLGDDSNMPGAVYTVNDIGPDGTGNVTLDSDDIGEGATNQYYTAERARDDIGAALVGGTGITVTPSDPGDTITIASTVTAYTDEQAQDAVAAAAIDTATIDFTYTDATPEFKWDVKNSSITYAKMQNVSATDKVLGRSTAGAGVVEEITLTAFARSLIDDIDAAAMRTTLGLVIGTNVQAFDLTLNSIAALGTTSERMLYTTGVDAWAELTTTSYGRAFLALANAAALATVMSTSAHGATLDTTPLDADEVVGMDSSASFGLIRTTWTSIKAFLKTYFDTLYGLLAGANTWTAANIFSNTVKFDEDVTLSMGTQDFLITDDGASALALASQTPGSIFSFRLHTKDGDGTDSCNISVFGVGTPAAITDRERLVFGYTSGGPTFDVFTEAAGTGVTRALILRTGANSNQLYMSTGGAVIIGLASAGATILGIKAGAGTNDAAVGGTLYVDSTQRGNTSTGVTDLVAAGAYSVPADTLSANNMLLEFHAWGTTAANGNVKKIDILWGSDSYTIFNTATSNAGSWSVRGKIVRTGAATQKVIIETQVTLIVASAVIVSTGARTLSSANILKLQGTGGATNDILLQSFEVKWADQNT